MTQRSVAFCRGINVGGHRATKDELIAPVAALGHTEVDTFLASGNILFRPSGLDDPGTEPARRAATDPTAEAMAAALEQSLGFPVPITIRIGPELDHLAAAQPFTDAELAAGSGKPQVIFLFDRSDQALADAVSAAQSRSRPEDLLVADPEGGAVHWLPREGISGSGVDPAELTSLFGTNTVRTNNTVQRLLAKA